MNIVPAHECFICAKEMSTDSPTINTNLECDCIQHQSVHESCFKEWYGKKGTCPVCRSTGPDTEAIRLQVREAAHTAQTVIDEDTTHLNLYKALQLLVLCIIFLSLIGLMIIVLDDDTRLHSHDEDNDDFAQISMAP